MGAWAQMAPRNPDHATVTQVTEIEVKATQRESLREILGPQGYRQLAFTQ